MTGGGPPYVRIGARAVGYWSDELEAWVDPQPWPDPDSYPEDERDARVRWARYVRQIPKRTIASSRSLGPLRTCTHFLPDQISETVETEIP